VRGGPPSAAPAADVGAGIAGFGVPDGVQITGDSLLPRSSSYRCWSPPVPALRDASVTVSLPADVRLDRRLAILQHASSEIKVVLSGEELASWRAVFLRGRTMRFLATSGRPGEPFAPPEGTQTGHDERNRVGATTSRKHRLHRRTGRFPLLLLEGAERNE